jgi:hypothetical protein
MKHGGKLGLKTGCNNFVKTLVYNHNSCRLACMLERIIKMFPTLYLVAILLILVACYFWYVSERSLARLKKNLDENSNTSLYQPQFRCVVISADVDSCCKEVGKYQSTPLLLNNAPTLPLLDCDAIKCNCTFMHNDDRRMGIARRDKQSAQGELTYANKRPVKEKRMAKDRRSASIQELLLPRYRIFG